MQFQSDQLNFVEDECPVITLPESYGNVLIGAACVGFLCILQGFIVVGKRRREFFTPEFLSQFQVEHSQYYESHLEQLSGYPDMGEGRYSFKLQYDQWREFNQAQRVHQQFLEILVPLMFFILVTGIYYPEISIALSILTIISRLLFIGYISDKGASSPTRILGALSSDMVLVAGFCFTIICGLKMACVLK